MQMPRIVLFLILLFAAKENQSQNQTVNWITMEQALKETNFDPKPIFVYFYTKNCGWCRKMETETLTNQNIINYLNTNYYSVKLASESTDTVLAFNHTFVNQQLGKNTPHDFVAYFLKGELLFPACTFLNSNKELILNAKGYRKPLEFMALLIYLKNNHFIQQPDFNQYLKTFKFDINE